MALYFSMRDLKAIRTVYNDLGISNSAVLDQIKAAITNNHFTEDSIMEIKDILTTHEQMLTKINCTPELPTSAAKAKCELIETIQIRSAILKNGNVSAKAVGK